MSECPHGIPLHESCEECSPAVADPGHFTLISRGRVNPDLERTIDKAKREIEEAFRVPEKFRKSPDKEG